MLLTLIRRQPSQGSYFVLKTWSVIEFDQHEQNMYWFIPFTLAKKGICGKSRIPSMCSLVAASHD
jgi:hypothetical protein